MIVSKLNVEKGTVYFDVSFSKRGAEISFYAYKEDFNVHFDNAHQHIGILKGVKSSDLEGFISEENMEDMDYWGYASERGYTPEWGENNNLLTMKDVKKIREEMDNILDWLVSIRKTSIRFEPIDDGRLKATQFILRKNWVVEDKSFDSCGEMEYRLFIVGRKMQDPIEGRHYYQSKVTGKWDYFTMN